MKLYDKTVLNFGILNQPLDFEEDCEITMPGYSNSLAKCVGTIETKRDTEKFKLENDTGSCFYVDRHDIAHDILQMYQDEAITGRYVTVKFRDENALGGWCFSRCVNTILQRRISIIAQAYTKMPIIIYRERQ